jgi:hypothetical protein
MNGDICFRTLSSLTCCRLGAAAVTVESVNRVRCQLLCSRNIDLEEIYSVSPSMRRLSRDPKARPTAPRSWKEYTPTTKTQASMRVQQLPRCATHQSSVSSPQGKRRRSATTTNTATTTTESDMTCCSNPSSQPFISFEEPRPLHSPAPTTLALHLRISRALRLSIPNDSVLKASALFPAKKHLTPQLADCLLLVTTQACR